MRLRYKGYLDVIDEWGLHERIVMAQYDDEQVVVYAPMKGKRIAAASDAGRLATTGGMLWLTTEFIAAANRSGWGQEQGMAALWVPRTALDDTLRRAVLSRYVADLHGSKPEWEARLVESGVRAQWDGLRSPADLKLERQSLWLGLAAPADLPLTAVENVSSYTREQGQYREMEHLLMLPAEKIYPVPPDAQLHVEKRSPQ